MGAAEEQKKRRLWLLVSLTSNLGLLAFFKYGNFFIDNTNTILSWANQTQYEHLDILLPVGISFYTFQTLSYTIDIYRGEMKPWGSFLDFALFVTFFPQLVAGPIVRATDFKPQVEQAQKVTSRQLGWGLSLAILGMFQKIVLSDTLLAPHVGAVYAPGSSPGFFDSWMATFAFAGQIYFDFAGYSICAIGVAMMLGFSLPDNFNAPYAAKGFSDFWRRWHMSLSTWLRDYLYISLGGNRRGKLRTQFNLFATMFLGGLWHGASWNFILWGSLHGFYLIVERKLRPVIGSMTFLHNKVGHFVAWLLTFLLTCLTWVPFRAETLGDTWSIFCGMMGLNPSTGMIGMRASLYTTLVVGGMLLVQRMTRDTKIETLFGRLPWWLGAMILVLMVVLIVTNIGMARAFIYFQF